MTAIPQPGSSRAVSDRIARPLRQVAARQWNVVAATGVLKTLAAALALLLLTAVILGTAATLPAALRIVVAALAWAVVAISGAIFLRPALRRRTLADAAFTVEQRTPGLDERLSSTVELSSELEPFAGSPALLRHLARQAEADAAALRPDLVVPADAVRRWAILLAPLLLLWLALAALFPRPLLGGLYRTLMPWKEHLPAVLTRIAVTPGNVTLAEGDALEINASINTSSGSEVPASPPLLLTAPLDAVDARPPLARDLQRLSPREFQASLDNLLQSFRYRVSTDQGESPWYTATVLPRPSVAALDLRYDYPPYARLDARAVANADGDVRALQGTDVTLTLHASESLDLAPGKSRIAVTEGTRQRTLELRPLAGQPNAYETKLTVFNSGSYRIQLVNRHGLANKDERPRAIAAELDQPPKVAITSPDFQVTVRPDDDVPVAFKASDDFGVAKVVGLVQVDDKPAEEHDVPIPTDADRRQIDAQYLINVAETLSRAGVDEAKAITYWLRVTDNRDPDPQSAESARQTLKIDKYQQLPYRARVEQEQAKDLTQAIDKAIQRLGQSEGQVNSLKSIDPKRPMNPDERRRSDEQRDQLGTTSKELADAAESNRRTSFRAVAEKARQVAEGPIQAAAEDVARSRLSDDQPEARNKAAARAAEQIVDARKRLEELKKGIEARAREVQSSHELEKLAERQTQLAEAQAKATPEPKKDDADPAAREARRQARQKLQQRQRELLDRLNRAIGQDESLRDPKAVEQAAKLRELLDRVRQIQKDQGALQEQVAKDEQVTALRDKSDKLAARQQKLNDEIEAFSEKRHATLRTADARTPERSHQTAIVDHLRKGEIDPARERQKQSVEQLKEAGRKLDERGRSNELKPDAVQQNALNLQEQAKQAAQQVATQAQQAGEKLKQAKTAKDAAQAAQAKKGVDEAADKLAKQAKAAEAAVAEALKSDDATAKKNAEDARRAANAAEAAADAARQAAQGDDAEQAAKKLEESAKQLSAARQKAADAVKADFVDDQRDAAKAAAAQAKELADRQKTLADAAKENAEALAKARKDQQSLEDVANRQGQVKDQTNQAKQQAEQLEQLAKADKSPLAERVEGAKKLLDAAVADQAEAGQSEQANAQAHRQIGQLLQQAGEADQQTAQARQQSAQAAEQANAHKQQAEAARQSQADAEARGDADTARASKEQAGREKQQADQDEQRAKQIEAQAEAPRQRAVDGLKQVNAARTTATASRRKAAEKQAAAQEALARAEDALRDVDRMTAASARVKRANTQRPDAGSTPPADAADADAGKQDPSDAQAATAARRAMTPEEAARQAARGAQEAAQSQQQAINSANDAAQSLDASRQAAAALQEAAAAMAAANAASSAASTDSIATAPEVQTPSQGLGKGEQVGTPSSARALESRNGIGVSAGGTDDRPASVQQLGISAGDWARLGPLTRQELLNAAQQNGPPAYREMIKNYYVRIAKLDREGRSAGSQSQTPTEPRNGKKR